MREVNDRRASCETVFNLPIHHFAPLYFNPRNPMLYKRRDIQEDLVILGVDRELLFSQGVKRSG